MELSESNPKKASAPMAAYQKFGSKLGAIVQLLKEIKEKDSQVPVMGQKNMCWLRPKNISCDQDGVQRETWGGGRRFVDHNCRRRHHHRLSSFAVDLLIYFQDNKQLLHMSSKKPI